MRRNHFKVFLNSDVAQLLTVKAETDIQFHFVSVVIHCDLYFSFSSFYIKQP